MNNQIELLVFLYMIKDPQLCLQTEPQFFNNKRYQELVSMIKPFVKEYHDAPTEEQVNMIIAQHGQSDIYTPDIIHSIWEQIPSLNGYNDEWLSSAYANLCEYNNFIFSLNKLIEYVHLNQQNLELETLHDFIEKSKTIFTTNAQFSIGKEVGRNFMDALEHKLTKIQRKPTGFKFLNEALGGGYEPKTLIALMAPPKAGKSLWLSNLAALASLSGLNVCYVTLELAEAIVIRRLGANLLNIPINDYDRYADDTNLMQQKLNDLKNDPRCFTRIGDIVVQEFPTSTLTAYELERFIIKAEEERSTAEKEYKFDVIYVDYLNIMADARNGKSAEMYVKIKNICEDLRAFAMRHNTCVCTVTQVNRSGYDNSDMDMSSVSESSGTAQTVDALIGIIQTSDMKARGDYYLKNVALRNSGNMGDKKRFTFSQDYLRITETDDPVIHDDMMIPNAGGKTNNSTYYGGPRKASNNTQQASQTVPPPPPPTIQDKPNLGYAELGIQTNDLFST